MGEKTASVNGLNYFLEVEKVLVHLVLLMGRWTQSGYMIEVALSSGSVMNGMKDLRIKINGDEFIGRPDNKDAPTKFSFSLPKLEEGQTVSLKTPQFFNMVF